MAPANGIAFGASCDTRPKCCGLLIGAGCGCSSQRPFLRNSAVRSDSTESDSNQFRRERFVFFPRSRFPKWWTRGFSRVFWRVWRKPVKVAAPEAIGVPGGNRPLVGGFLLIVKPSRFWGFTVPHGLASPLGLTARSRSCSYPRIRHTILRETGFLRLKGIKGRRLGSVFRISVNVRD